MLSKCLHLLDKQLQTTNTVNFATIYYNKHTHKFIKTHDSES